MKRAFWGTLIIILGLFGIVVINVFQNVTVDNDRVYYLIKESTQAAALDALDLTYYRLNGDFRIVEDKFVENLTRRFAENVTIGDYTIIVEDINEMPPKVSLRVRSGVTSLNGEEFGILNRVDGIIEAKYNLEEVLDFLGITEEEWNSRIKVESTDNTCNVVDIDEPVCIPGDLKFVGFSDATVTKLICHDETPRGNILRVVNYKECVCGNWEDKTQTLTANPVRSGNDYVYTWTFNKTSNVRTISESIKERVKKQVCTTGIQEMVPSDIQDKKPTVSTYEPSTDNSSYVVCPPGGIRIVKGMNFMVHPNYIPPNSVNRNLIWTVSDSNILGIQSTDPAETCVLNSSNNNCFSKAIVTAKNVGTSYINVKTTRGQTSSCLVNVVSGYVDNLSCNDLVLEYAESGTMQMNYFPSFAVYKDFRWSISDTNVATIDSNTGKITAKGAGTATVTISAAGNKKATCSLTVNPQVFPEPSCQDLSLDYNGSGTPIYSYTPSNATNATFKWSISDTSVATIDSSTGKVTAKGTGTATITMTGESGKTTTCKVTIGSPPPVSSPDVETGVCSMIIDEKVGVTEGEILVSCGYTEFNACSACGYATCKDAACGYATCKDAACGYAECADPACGYATCQDEACGKECLKWGLLHIKCKEYGENKFCQDPACGYATCKNAACGYATCKNAACGYAECQDPACGYAACERCGTKNCYATGLLGVSDKVTYYGYKDTEVVSGVCSGNSMEVTVNTYCIYTRTLNYDDPTKVGKTLVSTYSYNASC